MRLAVLALLLASIAPAATVADLVHAVRDAIQAKRLDPETAQLISLLTLTERLDDAVIEQLQSEGAGPQTIEQLERQQELSRSLPNPAQPLHLFGAPPEPLPEEQAGTVEKARGLALLYTGSLPDFICTETVRRYVEDRTTRSWSPRDTLTVEVAYSEKGERYKLSAIDGLPTTKKLEKVGGFKSNGEFGSLLRAIFAPESATKFAWERWTILHGRLTNVFSYRIDLPNSKYTLDFRAFLKHYHMTTGMLGMVYVDSETGQVMRFTDEAFGLPADWPILRTPAVVEYDYADIGGQKFLLPRRVDSRVVMRDGQSRNVKDFGNYRKFSGAASVSFEKVQ
jgi:hypothetical protein